MNSISFELDKNGIAVLRFDNPESTSNKLRQIDIAWMLEFLGNIDRQLDMIENEDEIRAVVLYSGKEKSFINGAELKEYFNFTLADEGRGYSLKAQEVTEKIESSRAPFIAAVSGSCLGMGLELILACTYRVASENSNTYFGMNEVENGLIPCAGGTQRLPRLIGTREALDLILSGETIDSTYAKELGLIDEVVPSEILLDISLERALQISNKEFKPQRGYFKGIQHTIVNENPIARKKLFNDVRKQANKDRRPSINSPIMAIEALEVGMSSFNRGLHVESVY
ncbi:MAG: enoyl-CoA hydratase-related protein, partial [Thermodesulfobacteriales bacterium]